MTTKRLRRTVFCFIFLLTPALSSASTRTCNQLLATLNAYKFISDERFLPDQRARGQKVDAVARLVASMKGGEGPDVLALIESDSTYIEKLLGHPLLRDSGLKLVGVSPIPDDRGNNLGLISRFASVADPVAHVYWDSNSPLWQSRKKHGRKEFAGQHLTRPIMQYQLRLPNSELLTVFVNHWPSKKLKQTAALQRLQAARYLRAKVDRFFADNPNANVMILGDFNATPDEPEIRELLRSRYLIHLEDLAEKKSSGSVYYPPTDAWGLFDQILISTNLLKYYTHMYGPITDARFVSAHGVPQPFDPRSGEGVTDHLPVGAWFNFN